MVAVAAAGCAGTMRALALVAIVMSRVAAADGQPVSMTVVGDTVRVRAPGWSFLEGEPLARLKDGRTVRVELALMAMTAPGKAPAAAVRQIFSLSYDLWEERFAVATAGARTPSISHLTAAAAEAWAVDQLSIPLASLGSLRDLRFWMRLECRILDGDGTPDPDDSGLTLQRIIDTLSRRKKGEPAPRAVEGGPFHLPSR